MKLTAQRLKELDRSTLTWEESALTGSLLDGVIRALLEHIQEQDETIAALRAGQGTPTGDTR